MSSINVINAESPSSFDYLVFPEQNVMNQNYILAQLSNFNSTLNDVGRSFIEASRNIYNKVNDSNAIRLARNAVRMAKGLFHPNDIVPLESLDELRTAQPMMQRYMMANPYIREQYQKQKCDGYSDTYYDVEPGMVKDDHYDYRRVMNGVIQVIDDPDSPLDWVSKTYIEELHEGDRDLLVDEQFTILSNWELAKLFMEADSDPTSIYQ